MTVQQKPFALALLLGIPLVLTQDPASKPAGPETQPATSPAASSPAPRDMGPNTLRGAAPIFEVKKERPDFTKKLNTFLVARNKLKELKAEVGTDDPKYRAQDKATRAAEEDLQKLLKTLGKKYNLDSECLAAIADWQLAFSESLVKRNEYKKAGIAVGSEQSGQLREEPKNHYTKRVPKTYDPQAKAWPLLLMIQDKDKHSKEITKTDFNLPAFLDGDATMQGTIVLAIDLPDGAMEDLQKLYASVIKPLRDQLSILRIDPNRIAVGGVGVGAKAAALVARFAPQYFSALVVKGGDPGDVRPENFINIPIYVLGEPGGWEKPLEGGDDKETWLSRARSAGVSVTQGAAADVAAFATWFSKQVRDPYSPRADAIIKSDKRRTAVYWLKYEPNPARESRIDAKIDRATNTIEIQCDGVERYFLFLSDALLDLTKVVKIKTNDKEWTGKLPPVYGTLIECLDDAGSVDWGALYTVKHMVDVPRGDKAKK